MRTVTPGETLGWDDVLMYRLWQDADVRVRRILKHLHCYPDRDETAISVAEYVEVLPHELSRIVDELEAVCERRYGLALPFLRRAEAGSELYCMPQAVTQMVHVVY